MRDDMHPAHVALHRGDEKVESVRNIIIALVLLVVLVIGAVIAFGSMDNDAEASIQTPESALDCPAWPHGPARNGSYVDSNLTVACNESASYRSGHDINLIRVAVRYDVAYGGSWHQYGPGRSRQSSGGPVSFTPFRNNCDRGAGGYPMRQRSVVRIEGMLIGPDHPLPDPFTVRRVHVARSDGRIGCGIHAP